MTSFKKVEGYQTNDGQVHATVKDAVEHQIKEVIKNASQEMRYDSVELPSDKIDTLAEILVTSPYNHQIANLLKELK